MAISMDEFGMSWSAESYVDTLLGYTIPTHYSIDARPNHLSQSRQSSCSVTNKADAVIPSGMHPKAKNLPSGFVQRPMPDHAPNCEE